MIIGEGCRRAVRGPGPVPGPLTSERVSARRVLVATGLRDQPLGVLWNSSSRTTT
jgi:hypothetical protein